MLILFLPLRKRRRVPKNRRIVKPALKSVSQTLRPPADGDDDGFSFCDLIILSAFACLLALPPTTPLSLLSPSGFDWFAAYELPFSITNINSPGEVASPQLQVEVHAKLCFCFVCCFQLRIDECISTRRGGGRGGGVATTDSAKDGHCLHLKRRQ